MLIPVIPLPEKCQKECSLRIFQNLRKSSYELYPGSLGNDCKLLNPVWKFSLKNDTLKNNTSRAANYGSTLHQEEGGRVMVTANAQIKQRQAN